MDVSLKSAASGAHALHRQDKYAGQGSRDNANCPSERAQKPEMKTGTAKNLSVQ